MNNTVSTPKPLVKRNELKSNCCNSEIMAVGDETSYWVCQKCNKACDPLEAPVESVSEPKAVDGYLKEFDERLLEMSPSIGRDMHNRPPLYDMPNDKVEEIRSFFVSSIERARREERERLLRMSYIRETKGFEPAKMSVQQKDGWLNLTVDIREDL